MKKILATVSGLLSSTTLFIGQTFAALPEPPPISGLSSETGTTGIKAAIVTIIQTVLDFILIVAVAYVVFAGIRMIISGGDEGEKDKAKTTIIYVAVGIVIVLFARVIVTFINNLLG